MQAYNRECEYVRISEIDPGIVSLGINEVEAQWDIGVNSAVDWEGIKRFQIEKEREKLRDRFKKRKEEEFLTSAFSLTQEKERIEGLPRKEAIDSVAENLEGLLAERNKSIFTFTHSINAKTGNYRVHGYQQRGDIAASYALSVENARLYGDSAREERFALENLGFEKARGLMRNADINSTIVFCSPTPNAEIEDYPGYNFLYLYHILPGETEKTRRIKFLSWINYFSKEEQAELINYISQKERVSPTESSIMLSPVYVRNDVDLSGLRRVWDKVEEIYSRRERNFYIPKFEEMQDMLFNGKKIRNQNELHLRGMARELAERIVDGGTLRELKGDFNKLLNFADKLYGQTDITEELENRKVPNFTPMTYQTEYMFAQTRSLFASLEHLNYEPEPVASGCDLPGAEKNSLLNPASALLKDSYAPIITGSFKIEDRSWTYHKGNCVNCSAKDVEVGPCSICKKCEKVLNRFSLENPYVRSF